MQFVLGLPACRARFLLPLRRTFISHSHTPVHPHHGHHPPKSRRHVTTTSAFVLASLTSVTFYALGSILPPQTIQMLFPRPVDAAPDTPEYVQQLEDELQQLPPLKKMREAEDKDDWYETRPYSPDAIPPETAMHNFTAGALRAPGKLAVPPLARAKWDESEAVIFVHVGRGVCGWPGVVHGGLLATVLDESMGRMAVRNGGEPGQNGKGDKGVAGVMVTKQLDMRYRRPTTADQWILVRTRLAEVGEDRGRRKVIVAGVMEDMEGNRLVEATGYFVQPPYSKLLSTGLIRKAMGEPKEAAS